MKNNFRTFIIAGYIILFSTGCSTKDKTVELPEINEIETVQYNSIKISVDHLETENLMALVQDLESLQPLKDNHAEMSGIYDTINLIYEDGSKDVFLFWKENDNWYAKTLSGNIYENADFVQNYINRTEMDIKQSIILPDLFWIKFLNTYGNYDDNYDILPELTNCLIYGYSLKQAAEITEAKILRNEMLYQYALSQNLNVTDEKLQDYISNIMDELITMPNYTDLETSFSELGTSVKEEIYKKEQSIRKKICIQMLYNDRYNAFRCGEDTLEETIYWNFESYWNAFVEKAVLTQQLSDESVIKIQITQALEYITSNKEAVEEELGIQITL